MNKIRTDQLTFKTDSLFESITYDKEVNGWYFSFTNQIHVSVEGFWRLLKQNKVVFVSLDNGQQFGHPKPLDLTEEITKQLNGKKLNEINIDVNTSDMMLIISNDFKIEIFISSSGYETYNLSIKGKNYIGLGSGEVAVFDNK